MRWKSFKFNIIQSAGKFIFNGTQRKKTMKLNYLVEGWREGKKNNGGPSAAAIRPRAELRTGLYMEPTFELPLVFSTGDGPPKPCGTWQKRWRRKSQDVGGGGEGAHIFIGHWGSQKNAINGVVSPIDSSCILAPHHRHTKTYTPTRALELKTPTHAPHRSEWWKPH